MPIKKPIEFSLITNLAVVLMLSFDIGFYQIHSLLALNLFHHKQIATHSTAKYDKTRNIILSYKKI